VAAKTEHRKRPAGRGAWGPLGPPYEFLDHPADVGFIARGRTLKELFENAATAMLAYGWELSTVRARQRVQIQASGTDRESLLYAWLSEILSLTDARGFAFKRVAVTKYKAQGTRYQVQGTAFGEPFDRTRHRAHTYIKAVTYHQLSVKEAPAGWTATVYLDV